MRLVLLLCAALLASGCKEPPPCDGWWMVGKWQRSNSLGETDIREFREDCTGISSGCAISFTYTTDQTMIETVAATDDTFQCPSPGTYACTFWRNGGDSSMQMWCDYGGMPYSRVVQAE